MRVVVWGTFDKGKPRTRILLRGLREAGVDLHEIHAEVWAGIEDKGSVTGGWRKLRLALRWLAAYPGLIWRYLRAPAHDAVLVGYLGHLDVLVLSPFARLRSAPVVWDAFLSLYDTVVEDRRLVTAANPLAWLLRGWEWLACRAARVTVLDTRAHADYFAEAYGLARERTASVFVGAETEAFPATGGRAADGSTATVLFYGQLIPLHGIGTILHAAESARKEGIHWIIIGRGQEEAPLRALIAANPSTVEWIPWVGYEDLGTHIARADICLGIFGDSGKAARVIPNKVFQVLSSGAPLITRDSPAIRELLSPDMAGLRLVPPADPKALLDAVRGLRDELAALPPRPLHRAVAKRITPEALGAEWRAVLEGVLNR